MSTIDGNLPLFYDDYDYRSFSLLALYDLPTVKVVHQFQF